MAHEKILDAKHAAFLVIDMQEGFRGIIPDFAQVAANIAIFLQGAKILDVPVIVTEQYPKGLGRTADEILFALELDIKQVIVAGIEAHICVNQTVHDLIDAGFQVHLLADCISTRYGVNKQAAYDKMTGSGAVPSTVEMALFELMRDAKHEHFKAIQALVK
jgi:nicotinamidase-related amidase